MHSPFKNRKASISSSESGIVVPIFAISLTMLMALMMLGIDGYLKIQARIEQQNVAEYLSLAALHGFYEPAMDDTDFEERNVNVNDALLESNSDNGVLGVFANDEFWNFSFDRCSCNNCSEGGENSQTSAWYIDYGNYDVATDTFTKVTSIDDENPNLCDTSLINAIKLELTIPRNYLLEHDLLSFFHKNKRDKHGVIQGAGDIKISSIAITYTVGSRRIFRIIKKSASGEALEELA